MDRDEALRLLRGGTDGIAEWNRRRQSGEMIPELTGANFQDCSLFGPRLDDERGMPWLYRANFVGVDFHGAVLQGTNFHGAILEGANFHRAILEGANFHQALLQGADFEDAILDGSVFTRAFLRAAKLHNASLVQTNLEEAILESANFRGANLERANLNRAGLDGANLDAANLDGADLSNARCGGTRFIDLNLSTVKGLHLIDHLWSSTISLSSLFESQTTIPQVFLRGIGVPDALIEYLPSLIGSMKPFQFHSCFISYSTMDEKFATKLHADLTAAGIRCWKWNHDARTGQTIWGEIDRAIPVHDKLVLIASEAALKSPPVNREIERAIQEEDRRTKLRYEGKYDGDTNVLFPVRLDDFIFTGWNHPRKADVIAKVIADAGGWDKGRKVYRAIRDRLIKDLKTE